MAANQVASHGGLFSDYRASFLVFNVFSCLLMSLSVKMVSFSVKIVLFNVEEVSFSVF